MLTWLVNYPGIFEQVEKYISPSDFVVPLYKEVAQMLFDQHKEERPIRENFSMYLQTARNREKWHHFLMPPSIWKTKENSREPFLIRCCGSRKRASKKNCTWDPSDMAGLQELIKAKRTGRPWKKEAAAAYFFQLRIKYKHYMEV